MRPAVLRLLRQGLRTRLSARGLATQRPTALATLASCMRQAHARPALAPLRIPTAARQSLHTAAPQREEEGAGPQLDLPTAQAITKMVNVSLDNEAMTYAQQLAKIKSMDNVPLMDRWQAMVMVFCSATMHASVPYGFKADDAGLNSYNQQYYQICQASPELREVNLQTWHILAERGFGVTLSEADWLPLENARQIASKLSLKMQSEAFLTTVDQQLKDAGNPSDQLERQRAAVQALFPLQTEVFAEFGYEGEDGFVRLHCALMMHQHDESMMYTNASGAMSLFRRAGIQLPGQA